MAEGEGAGFAQEQGMSSQPLSTDELRYGRRREATLIFRIVVRPTGCSAATDFERHQWKCQTSRLILPSR
jgi:hypothetical protein